MSLCVLAGVLALTLFAVVVLTACGDDAADSSGDLERLVVGAVAVPHAEMLDFLSYELRGKGIALEIEVYADYLLPNIALDAGEIDANFFQHKPYLESFNMENGTTLRPVRSVHFEPLALYPGITDSLDDIPQGATVAIPRDPTNGARALNLLHDAGLITLSPNAGFYASAHNIDVNDFDLQIVEAEAAQLPVLLPEVNFAVINGNYALENGLSFDTVLAVEEKASEAASRYANYLVTRADKVDDLAIQKLAEVLNSEELRNFIESRYRGRVVPTF